jgi:CHAT domain-containing protein
LHLATHLFGACGERGARLGAASLVTSDSEPVCADDIAALAPELPIALLSACWSGGGDYVDAEGLLGTARAFLENGTRNVLVTQWPVEDGAAAWYGVAFHRALLEGRSPCRAAATARAEMIVAGFAPADWAAFRLLGRD